MHATPTIIRPHRAQRLLRWAALWLAWLACAVYEALALEPRQPWLRRWLQAAARITGMILVVNAAARMTAPAPTRHRHGALKRRGRTRALVGGVLRRTLRGRDPQATLAALYAAITAPERCVARLMRRLRCGLTRLRTIAPQRVTAPCLTQTTLPPPCADSS